MTGYVLFFIYLLFFVFVLKKINFFKNIPGLSYQYIVFFFLLKVAFGITLSLLYRYYYDPDTADIYKYFNDGLYLYGVLWENPADYLRILTGIGIHSEHVDLYLSDMPYWFRPWESPLYNDNRVIIRFNALVALFSFGHIHVHTVFVNFLSFTGLVALYKFFLNYIPGYKIPLLKWGIFLFPSLLFWGSGLLKEGLLIGCFGMALYLTDYIVANKNNFKRIYWPNVIILMACLWILLLLKPYILVLFLPCLIGFYISQNKNFLQTQLSYVLLFTGLLIPVILLHLLLPEFDPIRLIANKQNNLINLSHAVNANSLLHSNYLQPEFWDILINAPGGFLTTLLRPHIMEVDSVLSFFAAIENLIMLLIIITSVIYSSGIKQLPITWLSFWFSLAGFAFIGLTSPVAGAIVRYKIMMLPFLWVFVLSIINKKAIQSLLIKTSKNEYAKNNTR